ncbi:MAG: hypothetical protein OXH06_19275 [Gemmatimonadetes bacterium]|nr:hypothetical protein [Gemmatimonadota bacterium]
MEEQNDQQREYRNLLTELEQKAYEDYDKALLAVSGGALAISIAFVKNIVGHDSYQHSYLLIFAWILWTLTILFVLGSFLMSQKALRQAIAQLDAKEKETELGGNADRITGYLNVAGGILFFVGVVLMVIFASLNLGESNVEATSKTDTATKTR